MGTIVSCMSNIMYLSEKVALYGTCAGLISCIVLTLILTLGMGIGLGYNYCFVDMKTKFKYVPGHYIYPGSPRWKGKRTGNMAMEEDPIETIEEEELTMGPTPPPDLIAIREHLNMTHTTTPRNFNKTLFVKSSILMSDNDSSTETVTEFVTEPSVDAEISVNVSLVTDKPIEIPEDNDEADGSSTINGTSESIDVSKTYMIDEIDEPTPDPPIPDSPSADPPRTSTESGSRRVKKLVIPISGLDLISLLSKLRAENKNYSLQIVTT